MNHSGKAGILSFFFMAVFWPLGPADAHPHVLIKAEADIQFNTAHQIVGVSNVWHFDEAFSAFAIQGYDSKNTGAPTEHDLQPLAKLNMDSLAEYKFFTAIKVDGRTISFGAPKQFSDQFSNEVLTLRFTLPTMAPVDFRGKTAQIQIYDPEYFAAISFVDHRPVRFDGMSSDCTSTIHRPEPLDAATAGRLAVIPASQRTLPPELFAITNELANEVIVKCP